MSDSQTFSKNGLEKMPTGIQGFDELTGGGLPRTRLTLLLGGPGSGKTVFALQTLVNGARKWEEPGIFVAFEENSEQIFQNAASFGWNLGDLEQNDLFFLDARMSVDAAITGPFDLSGMLASLKYKADEMQACRIVFDSVDVLLSQMDDPQAIRTELYRLNEWLVHSGMTGIITAKLDPLDPAATRQYNFIQYMADCVIQLNRVVTDRVSLRSLTVVKYRGSSFTENEVFTVIGPEGIEVPSLSSFEMNYPVQHERVSTGVERLDEMLQGGYLRGSSVLVTGSPGTAKSTLAGVFIRAACERGENALYISFDEGPNELTRNLSSVGIDFKPYLDSGLLEIYSSRAEARNAVEHLVNIKRLIQRHQPTCLVIDPLSSMIKAGGTFTAKAMAQRLIYEAKAAGRTFFITSLLDSNDPEIATTPIEISTIADTWIHLSYIIEAGERNRALTIIKSRGTNHSNQVREMILSDEGITLTEVYTAGGEVLMGTLRYEKERAEERKLRREEEEAERRRRELVLSRDEIQARMDSLQRELDIQEEQLRLLHSEEEQNQAESKVTKDEVRRLRGGEDDERGNE